MANNGQKKDKYSDEDIETLFEDIGKIPVFDRYNTNKKHQVDDAPTSQSGDSQDQDNA